MAGIRRIAYRFTTITKTMKPISSELLSCQLCLFNDLKQFSKSSGPLKVLESTRRVDKLVVPTDYSLLDVSACTSSGNGTSVSTVTNCH